MRLLHTGDWHLGHRLGEVCRANDILQNVRRIAVYLTEYNVDVLIVAGDLFCDRLSREGLKEALGNIEEIFVPFLERGGTILAVRGNHDNDSFCESLRSTLNLAPDGAGKNGVSPPGRFHLATRPRIVRLQDKQSGAVHPFVLMPYPGAGWLRDLPFEEIGSENVHKAQRISRYMHETVYPAVAQDAAAVLVSHTTVRGALGRKGYRLTEAEDVIFEQSDVPTHWAYGAFGHVHQADTITPNTPWMRYCGSVERLDAGEEKDDKSVVLIEIGRGGRTSDPTILPLPASPFLMTQIVDHDTDLAALEDEWANHPQRNTVLVKATIHYTPEHDRYAQAKRRLDKLFPRLYGIDKIAQTAASEGETSAVFQPQNIDDTRATAREYVARKLGDDPRKDVLLTMLEELFASEGVIN